MIGRSLVVHRDEDNLGRGTEHVSSSLSGNAGPGYVYHLRVGSSDQGVINVTLLVKLFTLVFNR